jgi:Zn-dependent protease
MRAKFTTSATEIKHIVLALFALSFAFQFILFKYEIFGQGMLFNPQVMLALLLQSLIVVGFAFVLHELAHKFMAQKKGLWAEFRAWPAGLLLAIGMAILSQGGFVFAAPGATMIYPIKKSRFGYALQILKPKDLGEIGLIGPIINILLCLIFGTFALLFPLSILKMGAQVNAWLAIFNLIPLSVLDGAKVWHWSRKIWACSFFISIFMFIITIIL